MKIDIVTIFPEMVDAALAPGVIGRARQAGVLDIAVHNLRDFTTDRHRVVDDVPFGGGPGMVLKPEPLFVAVETLTARRGTPDAVLLMSPAGKRLTQAEVRRFAGLRHLVVLCGRYEGIDERVREHLATDEVSIGDYVLSGGELPALVVVDAVSRLVPGVVGDEQSVDADSFTRGLLDYPHYTRPADYRGLKVPDVLTSGHHQAIGAWRRREALRRTAERRPDLLESARLDARDRTLLNELDGGDAASGQGEDGASAPPKKGSE
jgi:tRNA (guanine37-N1)-methyltransferase